MGRRSTSPTRRVLQYPSRKVGSGVGLVPRWRAAQGGPACLRRLAQRRCAASKARRIAGARPGAAPRCTGLYTRQARHLDRHAALAAPQVQNLVQRNEALQRELSELRAALDIAKRGEEELVRKNRLCERTIETLVRESCFH